MKRIYVAAAVAALMVASNARAEFFDGNKLLEICTKPQNDVINWADCIGYITGVADALNSVTICPPHGVTRGQVRDVVLRHMISSPQTRAKSGDLVVQDALRDVWPCESARRQPPATSNFY